MKLFNEETGLLMSEKGSYFISLHNALADNSEKVKEIKKLLTHLKGMDSEIAGKSIFDSFCFQTVLHTFNHANVPEQSLKDVQLDQYLLSINFCGLRNKEEISKELKAKYLRTQAALNVAKIFANAIVFSKMKSGQQISE